MKQKSLRIVTIVAVGAVTSLLTAAASRAASEAPLVANVTINDKGCEPPVLTVPAKKVSFKIKNASRRGVEWEILKNDRVVAERENIVPGFTSTLTTKLDPGEYEVTCGLHSNPKGRLIVKISTGGPGE